MIHQMINILMMSIVYILAGLTVLMAVSLFYFMGKENQAEKSSVVKTRPIEFEGYSRHELNKIIKQVQKNERNRKGYRFY